MTGIESDMVVQELKLLEVGLAIFKGLDLQSGVHGGSTVVYSALGRP
jgi:hypothetical protein